MGIGLGLLNDDDDNTIVDSVALLCKADFECNAEKVSDEGRRITEDKLGNWTVCAELEIDEVEKVGISDDIPRLDPDNGVRVAEMEDIANDEDSADVSESIIDDSK